MQVSIVDISDYRGTKQKFDKATLHAQITQALEDTGAEAMKLFYDIVSTWRHSVSFDNETPKQEGGDLVKTISTEDEPFWWLNEGVPHRKALMSRNFRPKTSVRTYKSGPGSPPFDPVLVHKMVRMPGIDAREWTPMMAEDMQPVLERYVSEALSGL